MSVIVIECGSEEVTLTIEAEPNNAVRAQPTPPPTPCRAKTSRDSSIRRTNLSRVARLQAMAVMAPMATDEATPTYPDAGVIPTRPLRVHDQRPRSHDGNGIATLTQWHPSRTRRR